MTSEITNVNQTHLRQIKVGINFLKFVINNCLEKGDKLET